MGWHSDPEPFKQDELRVLAGKSTYKVQGKCIIRGEERDIIASKRPLYNGDEIVGLVGSFVDITDVIRRKEKNDGSQVLYTIDKLRKYSFFDKIIDEISIEEILDPLTGILNRSYSMKFVRSLIAEKKPFTFSIIDLDNFKYINDTYGHQVGDKCIESVGRTLLFYGEESSIRFYRYGGDEFTGIVMRDCRIPIETIARDIAQMVNSVDIRVPSGETINITISVGYALVQAGVDYNECLKYADYKMYQVKQQLLMRRMAKAHLENEG